MIGQVRGFVVSKLAPDVLIDVRGIGYEVLVSLATFFDLPNVGEETTLHTHFVVREDAQLLFGFSSVGERVLFRHLIKVNGVGPKMALAILSGMSANEFAAAIRSSDVETLVKLPGVGKKTAERLVVEMRDKISNLDVSVGLKSDNTSNKPDLKQEAESALIALGYKPQDATKMISGIDVDQITSSEQLIRSALKSMVAK
jgi:Holliday junction DNA helicase RuvA